MPNETRPHQISPNETRPHQINPNEISMITHSLQEIFDANKTPEAILAIDYGKKKIGYAFCLEGRKMAFPEGSYLLPSNKDKINKTLDLIKKYNATLMVIGMPLDLSSNKGEIALEVEKFATNLSQIINIDILLQDERFTSKIADNLLQTSGIKRKRRNEIDDAIAASIILESVLNYYNKNYFL